ncbi:MAG: HNH endonuclease [Thermoguttaceae bacterium]|jgi:5-methylcytosine-specific restriction endonuclease McrA
MVSRLSSDRPAGLAPPKSRRHHRRCKRFEVFARDQFRCAYCGRDLAHDLEALVLAGVDHFVPQSEGGRGSAENLVSCCGICNQLKASLSHCSFEEVKRIIGERRKRLLVEVLAALAEVGGHLSAEPIESPMSNRPPAWRCAAGQFVSRVARWLRRSAAAGRQLFERIER